MGYLARFLHVYISVYERHLRYPHPPLNQSSYTIFSFHRLAGYLPHLASYFFGALARHTLHGNETGDPWACNSGYGAGESSWSARIFSAHSSAVRRPAKNSFRAATKGLVAKTFCNPTRSPRSGNFKSIVKWPATSRKTSSC